MTPRFEKLREELTRLKPAINHVNTEIFKHPETNFKERYSAEFMAEKLGLEGFTIKLGKGKLETAFEAVFEGKKDAPTIALICEYDALPGMGHACGHNLIAASAFGAGVALKNVMGDECGTLKVVGTPAEEGGGGKLLMIEEGWFNGVDAAIMVHPSNKTRVVNRMLAVMEVEYHFHGKAAHAAAHPDEGINALDGVISLFNNVNAMRQQTPDFSRVHGIVTHGGDAPNIIPEKASAKFMVRGLTMPDFEYMIEKLDACARGAAVATGCRLEEERNPLAYHPFQPNRAMGRIFADHLEAAGLEDVGMAETEEIGSSDIGNLSQVLPCLHPEYMVGDGRAVNHSRDFLSVVSGPEGEESMFKATLCMAATVAELFDQPDLLEEVKGEFTAFKAAQGE